MPGASARFEMTTAIRAPGMRPATMLSAMATKFEPRPESRMPRFFIGQHYSPRRHGDTEKIEREKLTLAEHHLAIALDDAADAVKFFSGALQQRLRFLEFLGGDHDQHTEAHIEGAEHL